MEKTEIPSIAKHKILTLLYELGIDLAGEIDSNGDKVHHKDIIIQVSSREDKDNVFHMHVEVD